MAEETDPHPAWDNHTPRHASTRLPRLNDGDFADLIQIGLSGDLIDDFREHLSCVTELLDRIPELVRVRFPATQTRPDELNPEFLRDHWKEIVGRLHLAQLSANRTLRDLLLGFLSSLQDRNPLCVALTSRSAIESAALFRRLGRTVAGRKEKIEAQVLPFLQGGNDTTESLYDRALIEALVRFQHGARLWPTGSCPDTVAGWGDWREHSLYEPADTAKKHGHEQSTAGQILDALNANQQNVLTAVEKISGRSEHMELLPTYDFLSEFCHPNAENRRIGFVSSELEAGDAVVEFSGGRCLTPGTRNGIWLGIIGMIHAIDIHLAAHNEIYESTHAVSDVIARS